jgi:hypothetical protein
MQHLLALKKEMQEQMDQQDLAIREKSQQLKFYKEQKSARDMIMRQR